MEPNAEIRPYVPKEMDAGALYTREVKRQLLKVLLVVGAYLLIQFIVGGIIEAALMFSSGLMDNIMQGAFHMAQGGGMTDYNDLLQSSQASVQDILKDYVGLISIVSAVAGLPVFLLLRGKRLFTTDITVKYAPLSFPSFMKLWVIAMGAQLVFNVGASLINRILEPSGNSVTELLEQTMQMLNTPTGLLYICLIGPIVEEIVFRGAVMKSLERFGLNFSIILSALIFGLFHIFTVQAVFAFFMGIILGYIASRYSLKWSILAHILINSVAMGIEYIGMTSDFDPATGIGEGASFLILSSIILYVLFGIGIVLLIKERWRFAEQRAVGAPIRIPGSPERTGAALWQAAFTSIPLLIYIGATVSAGIIMIITP
ncbi:MAG: CPBP family intramembrane metalloprotease [Clostridiales Family XIII bacterium]|jgi:membrane protease YdiL (CAAX protease family)|nr:CPBP family intramembrane metalloprotease [Clostridiales Family XIII bacterium]